MLLLNSVDQANPTSQIMHFNFKVVNQFQYLGIEIVPNIEQIVKINYEKIKDEINTSIDRWRKLPISMMGRVNVLKMMVLPKLLYMFQNIPLPPPLDLFTWLKKSITNSIWNNGKPKLRLSLLYLPFDGGGLKCPNFIWYHWAAQLRSVTFYFSKKESTHWVEMEGHNLKLPLPLFLYSEKAKNVLKQIKKSNLETHGENLD